MQRTTCRRHSGEARSEARRGRRPTRATNGSSPVDFASISVASLRCSSSKDVRLYRRRASRCSELTANSRSDEPFVALGGWCRTRPFCIAVAVQHPSRAVGGPSQVRVGATVARHCERFAHVSTGLCRAELGASAASRYVSPRQPLSAAMRTPRAAMRARFTDAASRAKSAATRARPRTRARRPPCLRRIRWPSLRSTFGRVAR